MPLRERTGVFPRAVPVRPLFYFPDQEEGDPERGVFKSASLLIRTNSNILSIADFMQH
jgi:hypothetical protein